MGSPLNKRYLKNSENNTRIHVLMWDNKSNKVINGWIENQTGSRRYKVTNGIVSDIALLKSEVTGPGEMVLTHTSENQPVIKLTAKKATLADGRCVQWTLTDFTKPIKEEVKEEVKKEVKKEVKSTKKKSTRKKSTRKKSSQTAKSGSSKDKK